LQKLTHWWVDPPAGGIRELRTLIVIRTILIARLVVESYLSKVVSSLVKSSFSAVLVGLIRP
jgi:hypothetical protein